MLAVIHATHNNVTITEAPIDQIVVPPTAFVIESVSDNYHYQSYPPSTDEPPPRAIAGTLLDSRPLALRLTPTASMFLQGPILRRS